MAPGLDVPKPTPERSNRPPSIVIPGIRSDQDPGPPPHASLLGATTPPPKAAGATFTPSSSRSQSGYLLPPTPTFAFTMADDAGTGDGDTSSSGVPSEANPFNFQTQFMSTSPVKSVRYV